MSRYYLLTQALALAGGFVVVTTFAFGGAVDAISFAVSVAILIGAAATQLAVPAERRRLHRGLASGVGVVAAWTILVSLGIFSGGTQTWLEFAGGAAVLGLSLAGGAVATVARDRAVSDATPQPAAFTRARAA